MILSAWAQKAQGPLFLRPCRCTRSRSSTYEGWPSIRRSCTCTMLIPSILPSRPGPRLGHGTWQRTQNLLNTAPRNSNFRPDGLARLGSDWYSPPCDQRPSIAWWLLQSMHMWCLRSKCLLGEPRTPLCGHTDDRTLLQPVQGWRPRCCGHTARSLSRSAQSVHLWECKMWKPWRGHQHWTDYKD
jgi:hypothetical protein